MSPGSGSSDGKESSAKAEPHNKKPVASTIASPIAHPVGVLVTSFLSNNPMAMAASLLMVLLGGLLQFCSAQQCTSPVQCNAARCLDCSCVNGKCSCGAGWSGPGCDTPFCYNRTQCNNHGNCNMQVKHSRCACYEYMFVNEYKIIVYIYN